MRTNSLRVTIGAAAATLVAGVAIAGEYANFDQGDPWPECPEGMPEHCCHVDDLGVMHQLYDPECGSGIVAVLPIDLSGDINPVKLRTEVEYGSVYFKVSGDAYGFKAYDARGSLVATVVSEEGDIAYFGVVQINEDRIDVMVFSDDYEFGWVNLDDFEGTFSFDPSSWDADSDAGGGLRR